MIEPELELTHADRAHLQAVTVMDGYAVIHRIMRAEADKFIVALLNADASNDAEILARHKLAKAAAQYYTAVTNHIDEEAMLYTAAPRPTDKPLDVTEGVIDIGEITERFAVLPNLFSTIEEVV